MVTISGTAFALVTGALPQWKAKIWPACRLHRAKRPWHSHEEMDISTSWSSLATKTRWDLEAISSARLKTRPETRWVFLALATFWTALLITVSGLKEYSWFLIGIGGLGTLQNIYVAAAAAKPEELNIRLRPHPVRSTVRIPDQSAKQDLRATDLRSSDEEQDNSFLEKVVEEPGVNDVMGALMELKKLVPKVGAALPIVFFPGGVKYEPARLYSNRERKFWKSAFREMKKRVPRRVEQVPVSHPKSAADIGYGLCSEIQKGSD